MNILTFDVEEWFHILDNNSTKTEKEWMNYESRIHNNMDRIFELLDRNNQKATFFCLGWIGRKHPDIIRRISENGYEVATHSDSHQLAYEQSKKIFKADLEKSIKSLEDITGKKVISYRAPGFSVKEENKWIFAELVKYGIEIDCSIFPAKRSHGGFESYGRAEPSLINIDGVMLKEFPINLYNIFGNNVIFSGGGYFRLLPYGMINYMMKRSNYVMTYFHPRDFDSDQPMINDLSRLRKFKSYYGLKGSMTKLEQLIEDFEFIDLTQAVSSIDWSQKPIVNI